MQASRDTDVRNHDMSMDETKIARNYAHAQNHSAKETLGKNFLTYLKISCASLQLGRAKSGLEPMLGYTKNSLSFRDT